MSLDPIRTTKSITDSYLDYLSTTFDLKDPDLHRQFTEQLRETGKFVKGPILEATPPFQDGATIEHLIREGVLSRQFRKLRSAGRGGPLHDEACALYAHQEEAIRKAVQHRRNIVVATGTGSGKTEAFLVPVLNHLFREQEREELGPGVRALLLYPMNALANDQMARLRELLRNCPGITFGRYTGETKEDRKEAIEKYRKMFRRQPCSNELVSRNQMRESPPHILLTNYAMLEYLLLRPDDHVFFDGTYAGRWRFLVIDEAHTYAGAKGIEMAMLLRRLKDRVVAGDTARLKCVATSATLGQGDDDFPAVALFAERLFGEEVSWVPDDESRQDVVQATRKPLGEMAGEKWNLAPVVYRAWQRILEQSSESDCISRMLEEARQVGISDGLLDRAEEACNGSVPSFLYEILRGDERVATLRALLEERPRYVADAATGLFGESPQAQERTAALVELAARARRTEDEQALLPARYHLFVRAIEGAFVALSPDRRLFVERQETARIDGQDYAVFELATCRQCGATYLVGEEQEANGRLTLEQPGNRYYEHPSNLTYYLLLDQATRQVPENEDEAVGLGGDVLGEEADEYRLCVRCGAIDKGTLASPLCGCEGAEQVHLIRLPSKGGNIHKCPACGRQSPSNLVWRFLTGRDATASVLAAALYQHIPPRHLELDESAEASSAAQDSWSSTGAPEGRGARDHEMKGEGRQLLIFSDSRQDAAFFAPYLSRTYSQILRRRLILQTLEDHRRSVLQNKWRVEDLVNPLQRTMHQLGMFPDKSLQGRISEAWKWILYELLAVDRRNSLEGLGCLGFSLVRPDAWNAPKPLLDWGLDEDEVWILFAVLLDSLRTKGAILFPDAVSPQDEFFAPRNREYYFRGNGSNNKRHISSWAPSTKAGLNSRLDYLVRLAEEGLALHLTREDCARVLKILWNRSFALHNPGSCWAALFSSIVLPGEDVVYRMKPQFWELRPGAIDPEIPWYYCDTCHSLTLLNLRGVCPTYRCAGRLRRCHPAEVFRGNHYRRLYTSVAPIDLVAREHTAQLTGESAAELQTQFIEGEVNVLSCSTTFELGVDVGQLETVFMRNVPPTAANYVQRAGRAGRRTSSTAFALTFAQRRSHDLSHFNDPIRMVSGQIKPPHFAIANEKIVRRHMYATALADFWKAHPGTFGSVESFFFREGRTGPELLADHLEARSESLAASLGRIVPGELQGRLGLEQWSWISGLLDQEGVLSRASEDVTQVVAQLETAWHERFQQNRPSDFLLRVINTIKKTYLIDFLSRKNVIPKYGFPVDVVGLQILHHSDEARGLQLDRDLRIALSEYAPSSQVVAGGKVWTSRYIRRLPDREWLKYDYAVCRHCQCYQSVPAETGQTLEFCQACGQPLGGRNQGRFLVPQFGFIASVKPPEKPGDSRPEKTYTSRTYYSGKSKPSDELVVPLRGTTLTAIPASEGELAVVNHAGYKGFKVCHRCGYTVLGSEPVERPHTTPWGRDCEGTPVRIFLGHEFKTDVLQLRFGGCANATRGFWLSLLYAVLEGASESLDIDRRDLDGCLYPYAGDPCTPALVLFDDVPGGAGHVRRVASDEATLRDVLHAALSRLRQCSCGGDEANTSCYGCLRNYRNQYCHEELERGVVIHFLEQILSPESTRAVPVE